MAIRTRNELRYYERKSVTTISNPPRPPCQGGSGLSGFGNPSYSKTMADRCRVWKLDLQAGLRRRNELGNYKKGIELPTQVLSSAGGDLLFSLFAPVVAVFFSPQCLDGWV